MRLAAALSGFWRVRGHFREGRERLERVFATLGAVAPSEPLAHALSVAGSLAAQLGDDAGSRLLLERSLAAWRTLGNRRRSAGVLLNLGTLAFRLGDYGSARAVLEEALAMQREFGVTIGMALSLNNLGLVMREEGNPAAARLALEESLALKRQLGDVQSVPATLISLGDLALEHDSMAAAGWLRQGLAAALEVGDLSVQAEAMEAFARLTLERGEPEEALVFAGAADALRERVGSTRAASNTRRLQDTLTQARAALAPGTGQTAWQAGREARLDDTIRAALTIPVSPDSREGATVPPAVTLGV